MDKRFFMAKQPITPVAFFQAYKYLEKAVFCSPCYTLLHIAATGDGFRIFLATFRIVCTLDHFVLILVTYFSSNHCEQLSRPDAFKKNRIEALSLQLFWLYR